MTLVDCKHENAIHTDEIEIDGVVYNDPNSIPHEICIDCQSHVSCDASCEEYKKYLRMKGLEPDGELPF